jgi:hypothetical protein
MAWGLKSSEVHHNVITLLDREGNVAFQLQSLNKGQDQLIQKLSDMHSSTSVH